MSIMRNDDYTPCPEDSCCHGTACENEALIGSSAPSIGSRDSERVDDRALSLPFQAARADAASEIDRFPFVLHAGTMLFMVAEEGTDWVVAELRFDAESCTFTEVHTSRFHWPREAFGRLLSRAVVGEEIDSVAADRVTDAFSRWVAAQFVA
jgi:hypothetical protein